jgi:hypothetical protein
LINGWLAAANRPKWVIPKALTKMPLATSVDQKWGYGINGINGHFRAM